ncbi:hypothetical protein [Leptospira stimsonii]|nr:hypothetical protein [Leptospira stimsonii]
MDLLIQKLRNDSLIQTAKVRLYEDSCDAIQKESNQVKEFVLK